MQQFVPHPSKFWYCILEYREIYYIFMINEALERFHPHDELRQRGNTIVFLKNLAPDNIVTDAFQQLVELYTVRDERATAQRQRDKKKEDATQKRILNIFDSLEELHGQRPDSIGRLYTLGEELHKTFVFSKGRSPAIQTATVLQEIFDQRKARQSDVHIQVFPSPQR